ncbi:hypothetical protein ACT7DL_05725 [Bacillus paranthracis]
MLTYEAFAVLITILVLAPIFGAIILLCLFIFEKRIDLLESEKEKNSTGTRVATVFISSTYATNSVLIFYSIH